MSETFVSIDGIRTPVLESVRRKRLKALSSFTAIQDQSGTGRAGTRCCQFGRALAMDMPGFGTADKPEDFDYSVPGYARHLGKLLAERGVRRAHLVMHDFGGPWGLAGLRTIRRRSAASPASIPAYYRATAGTISPAFGRRRSWANCLWLRRPKRGCACCYDTEIREGCHRNTSTTSINPLIGERGARC